jgi:hypothetical protein
MPTTKLKFLHSASTLNQVKLEFFRRLSTGELKASLVPGQPGSLKVRGDGTVLDGHHRASILAERGENIDRLPREIMEKQP